MWLSSVRPTMAWSVHCQAWHRPFSCILSHVCSAVRPGQTGFSLSTAKKNRGIKELLYHWQVYCFITHTPWNITHERKRKNKREKNDSKRLTNFQTFVCPSMCDAQTNPWIKKKCEMETWFIFFLYYYKFDVLNRTRNVSIILGFFKKLSRVLLNIKIGNNKKSLGLIIE